MVTPYCTCGARLPEDARFCHKCGKPQRDEELAIEPRQEEAVQTPLPAPITAEPLPISFRNTAAVRIGLLVSFLVALMLMVPGFVQQALSIGLPGGILILWQVIVLVAAGFFSVYLYYLRTGQYLTVGSGARMGWISGVFCFLVMLVMFTVVVAASDVGIGQFFEQSISTSGTPETRSQFREVLSSPVGVGLVLLFAIVTSLAITALFSIAGGALGAKVLEKE